MSKQLSTKTKQVQGGHRRDWLIRSPSKVSIEVRVVFNLRMCYLFQPVGGAVWEISDEARNVDQ